MDRYKLHIGFIVDSTRPSQGAIEATVKMGINSKCRNSEVIFIGSREMLLGMLKPFAILQPQLSARPYAIARSYAIVHPFVCYLPFICSSQQGGRVPCWGVGESLDGEERESPL